MYIIVSAIVVTVLRQRDKYSTFNNGDGPLKESIEGRYLVSVLPEVVGGRVYQASRVLGTLPPGRKEYRGYFGPRSLLRGGPSAQVEVWLHSPLTC